MVFRYQPGYIQSVLSSGRCSVSVWGAMSADGLGPLVRISGPFNASQYCNIISTSLLPYVLDGCFILQQDRSPVFTARAVSSLLEDHAVRQLRWPPCGADLNPIENVWGIMKMNLGKRNDCGRTADELWQAVEDEWGRLRSRPEIIKSLYESLHRRIREVIENDGNFTRN